MYGKLIRYKEQRSVANDKNEFDHLFLKHVDTFIKQCETALSMLNNPEFDKWVEETIKNKSLCHQDYAAANLVIGRDGNLYVFDMDSLTVDLPVRDIRKILNKVMKKQTDLGSAAHDENDESISGNKPFRRKSNIKSLRQTFISLIYFMVKLQNTMRREIKSGRLKNTFPNSMI